MPPWQQGNFIPSGGYHTIKNTYLPSQVYPHGGRNAVLHVPEKSFVCLELLPDDILALSYPFHMSHLIALQPILLDTPLSQ